MYSAISQNSKIIKTENNKQKSQKIKKFSFLIEKNNKKLISHF